MAGLRVRLQRKTDWILFDCLHGVFNIVADDTIPLFYQVIGVCFPWLNTGSSTARNPETTPAILYSIVPGCEKTIGPPEKPELLCPSRKSMLSAPPVNHESIAFLMNGEIVKQVTVVTILSVREAKKIQILPHL
jgi:hypothetical protein